MKISLKGTEKLLSQIREGEKKMTKELSPILERAALGAQGLIKSRVVEKGKDVNEAPFEPYSPSYLKKKKEKGGRFFKNHVNLFSSGLLMGVMGSSGSFDTRKPSNNSIMLYVSGGPAKYGLRHQIGDNAPKREWFGLSKREAEVIHNQMLDEVSKILGAI